MGFVRSVASSIGDAVSSVGRAIDDAIIQPVAHTVESIAEDPRKLAMVALSVMAPGAGTALGAAMGLSGTVATLVGQAAINTALNGGDVRSAIMAAALPVAGKELAGAAAASFVESGMDKALAQSAGNVVSGAGLAAATGKDPLQALIAGGLSAGTAAVTRDIPGFSDLPLAAQKTINAAVASELNGKDPTQAVINSAINTGLGALRNYSDASANESAAANPYFDANANTGALPGPDTNTNAGTSGSPDISAGPDTPDEPVGALPKFDTDFAPDYSLSSNTHAAPTFDDMGGAQGLQVPADNSAAASDPGNTPVDYSLNTNVPFDGLQKPTAPNDPSMGGGQGLTIPVDGGTTTGSGLIGDTYTPALGDPNSFINGGTGGLSGNSAPATTAATQTTAPATTQANTSTASKTNPFGVLPLDSSPQMLTSTMPADKTAAQAGQLRQLFDSLTPGVTHAAGGGLISDSTAKILADMNPKFVAAPTHLQSVAPQTMESRLGALMHMAQGPLKGRGLTNRMAQGGLPSKYAEAAPEGHKPEFITGLTGYYAQGGGTGQSDDISAMLHDGDFVMDADTVASLGDGSSKAGAQVLAKMQSQVPHHDKAEGNPVPAQIADGEYVFPAAFVTAIGGGSNKLGAERLNEMREKIRAHKRSAPTTKIPPKAKSPLDYLKMAKG